MYKIGLVVPVLNNFTGFAELMSSVDEFVKPYIIPNWNDNIGVSKAWNQGIKKSIDDSCEFTIIVNDDVIFLPGCINKLMTALQSRIFITACTQNHITEVQYNNEPDFACFMMRPQECVEKYGWFSEDVLPIYFNDNLYSYKMKMAGDLYEKRIDAHMIHKGSVTQNSVPGGIVPSIIFEQNRQSYVEMCGGQPLSETFTHPYNNIELDWKDF